MSKQWEKLNHSIPTDHTVLYVVNPHSLKSAAFLKGNLIFQFWQFPEKIIPLPEMLEVNVLHNKVIQKHFSLLSGSR